MQRIVSLNPGRQIWVCVQINWIKRCCRHWIKLWSYFKNYIYLFISLNYILNWFLIIYLDPTFPQARNWSHRCQCFEEQIKKEIKWLGFKMKPLMLTVGEHQCLVCYFMSFSAIIRNQKPFKSDLPSIPATAGLIPWKKKNTLSVEWIKYKWECCDPWKTQRMMDVLFFCWGNRNNLEPCELFVSPSRQEVALQGCN